MKILRTEFLVNKGNFKASALCLSILNDVKSAIMTMKWPPGSNNFTLREGKNANGVVPIKKDFMVHLQKLGWKIEHRMSLGSRVMPGPIDAVKEIAGKKPFAVEWETGNISSSHRALNKMSVGLMENLLCGGILILPSRDMYYHLTDRVGNFAEIMPYFPIYRSIPVKEGGLAVIEIEHDGLSADVPAIKKGTDGRALR